MVEISNRHLWRTEAGFWLMWILVEMSQPGVATSARWEKRWWQNGAAGGGVGGAPPPHSWAESSSDWPVLLSRANLTRRPHRPRRCHTEHSTTAITSKNHNRAKTEKNGNLSGWESQQTINVRRWHLHFCSFCSFLRDVNQTFGKCQTVENTFDIWYLSSLWKCILLWSHDVLFVSGMFKSSSWEKSDPHCTWNESKGNPSFWLMLRLSCILENWLKTLPWKMLFENCSKPTKDDYGG